ncbi:phospholipase A2, membrane associated [Nannospalax galili]|uniref:Phospholipase A2 n=1 Tax=Nannospalax galili TaxID=1026970 RepID=A0A8C6Q919_NANGA|nr:phospholipase A2, membrane associated [Nannospalax galili]
MKILLLLVTAIVAFGPMQVEGSLVDFNKMIQLKTGKIAGSSYAFYGCHCGLGGKGAPKDATDWCCATHDCCYYHLKKQDCGTKFLPYKFTHSGGKITCAADQNSCKKQLCECDKAAAECFARNLRSYSTKYQFYYNTLCHGVSPKC